MNILIIVAICILAYILGAVVYLRMLVKRTIRAQKDGTLLEIYTHYGNRYSYDYDEDKYSTYPEITTYSQFRKALEVMYRGGDDWFFLVPGTIFWPISFAVVLITKIFIGSSSLFGKGGANVIDRLIAKENKKEQPKSNMDEDTKTKLREAIKGIEGAEELEEIINNT